MSKKFSAVFVCFDNGFVKSKPRMFEAPYYTSIEIGDRVKVEDVAWECREGFVVAVEYLDLEYNSDRKQFELLQKVTGTVELPLKKVLSVIKETEIEYDEEEDEENGEN